MNSEMLLKTDYKVRSVHVSTCQSLVERYHYARGGSNTGVYCHGLFHKLKPFECLGVAWWIPPTKDCAIANYPEGDWRKVLTLSRLVVLPEVPRNGCSFLMMRSIRLIKQDNRFSCLLTYADEWQQHTGHIYKATGWDYLGLTDPQPCWIDPATGRMVARKAGPKTRTNAEMKALGYVLLGHFRKHRFRYILEPAKTRPMFALKQLSLEFV